MVTYVETFAGKYRKKAWGLGSKVLDFSTLPPMNKLNYIFCVLAATLVFACAFKKEVGLKENWIDERDMMALTGAHVSEWMVKAGRPTLVEISGDTAIYYYNYRPTMYATTIYDSTKIIASWGTAKETKPALENSMEVWGSRKNTMQIKVVGDVAISAIITEGPDKKTYVRDLNGTLVLDQSSGYNSNVSQEQKINSSSEHFKGAYSKLSNKEVPVVVGTNMSPWEQYRHKQELEAAEKLAAEKRAAAEAAAAQQQQSTAIAQPAQPIAQPEQPIAQPDQPVAQPVAQPAAQPADPPMPVNPDMPVATEPPPALPFWQ